MTLTSATPAHSKALELARFLDDLDRAFVAGPRAFDTLFNAPPTGFSVHEILPDKTFTRVSPAHQTLIGHTPQSMIGRPASDFVVLKETSERAIARKLAPGAALLPFNRTWKKPDGTEVTLLMLDRHIKNTEGQITGIRTAITEA
jgi:PAS domain S-box-containing protein